MTWMNEVAPAASRSTSTGARGARVTDIDGHEYVDFCARRHRGDGRPLAGADRRGGRRRRGDAGGITAMMPTEDAAWVGDELARRFGLPALVVHAHRDRRQPLGAAARPPGHRPAEGPGQHLLLPRQVDEAFASLGAGRPGRRRGRATSARRSTRPRPPGGRVQRRRRRSSASWRTATSPCVLMEPALTNIGIVLPEPGYLDAAARAARASTGTLLIDRRDAHVLGRARAARPAPGGSSRTWSRSARRSRGGVPIGAYGLSRRAGRPRSPADEDADLVDVGGVGGTLAGNALSLAAARATLEHVLTDAAFARHDRPRDAVHRGRAAASIADDGCRGRSSSSARARSTGSRRRRRAPARVRAAADDAELDDYLHLYLANRGVLITPFHNMALMCPATTDDGRRPPHRGVRGRGALATLHLSSQLFLRKAPNTDVMTRLRPLVIPAAAVLLAAGVTERRRANARAGQQCVGQCPWTRTAAVAGTDIPA